MNSAWLRLPSFSNLSKLYRWQRHWSATRNRWAVSVGLLLSACTSFEPLRPDIAARSTPSRLDEIAYINSLREAFDFSSTNDSGCYDGAQLRHFRPTLEQGYPDHTREQEEGPAGRCAKYKTLEDANRNGAITRYLEAGFGLTDLYCQRYFVIAAESAQKRRFQRNTGSTVDALVNAVLGVAKAGETALTVANAGFEAYDSTYQNIEDAFMVSPEIENVRKLVHAAQLDYRTQSSAQIPGSYQAARSVIERYAGLCSYTGMKQLVNDSVSAETKALLKAAEAGGNTTTSSTNTSTNTGANAGTRTGTVTSADTDRNSDPASAPQEAPEARVPVPTARPQQ